MAWYFQTSPHDMHDWDSAQTPILFEAMVNGKPRKLVSTAARNGYFFTLDRMTGEHIVTIEVRRGDQLGQERRQERLGAPQPDKDPTDPGRDHLADLGRHDQLGTAGLLAGHGLFYVTERNGFSIYYLTDPDPRGSMGLGGKEEVSVGSTGNFLTAIDPLDRQGGVAASVPERRRRLRRRAAAAAC